MPSSPLRLLVPVALVIGATIAACDDSNPVSPANHNPTILSLAVFPQDVDRSDSAIVICAAMDSDGDTLVYDWVTDGRLNIKGGLKGYPFLYNTFEPTRVFYPAFVDSPVDTAWIECSVRDRRGGIDTKLIKLTVHY